MIFSNTSLSIELKLFAKMRESALTAFLSLCLVFVFAQDQTAIRCPTLPNPIGGRLVGACQESRVNDECSLECDEGYRNLGVYNTKCVVDQNNPQKGVWANQFGTCEKSVCPVLSPPSNGYLTGECSRGAQAAGATCVAQCNAPNNVAPVTLKCLDNGKWDGTLPICNQVAAAVQPQTQGVGAKVCVDINPPIRGMTAGVCSGAKNGDVCKFHCQDGSKLQGLPSLLCNPDHTWSGPPPTCA